MPERLYTALYLTEAQFLIFRNINTRLLKFRSNQVIYLFFTTTDNSTKHFAFETNLKGFHPFATIEALRRNLVIMTCNDLWLAIIHVYLHILGVFWMEFSEIAIQLFAPESHSPEISALVSRSEVATYPEEIWRLPFTQL